MSHPLDIMVARSMAHEREHDLRSALRTREAISRRVRTEASEPAVGLADARHHWLHDLLVRVHLAHAPIH